jgi:hypothetical protein
MRADAHMQTAPCSREARARVGNPAVRQQTEGGARGETAERSVVCTRSVARANGAAGCRMNGSMAGMLPAGVTIGENPAERGARRPVPRCHEGDR